MLGKARFEPVDFSQLPANYHNEEKKEQIDGNTTVYSHREISKVSEQLEGVWLVLSTVLKDKNFEQASSA